MKLPGYRNCSAGGVFCAPSASSAEEFDRGTDFSIHDSEGDVMATATQSAHGKELDTKQRSSTSRHFEEELRQRVVGQNEAVQALVDLYQVFCAGLHSAGRPVGNLLFLGPTGSGKTRTVEAAAEILFGDSRAVIKVDCAEFQHSHEISKLIGSPPGYLGHRETHPLITQEALAASHTGKLKLSFLLFDEIEKASDALWQLLLGMLHKATLTLGGMGFVQPKDIPAAGFDEKDERTAVEAARRKFSPEFMNRLDKVVVFHPLRREQLEEVLDIELGQVQQRVLETAKGQFLFRVTGAGKEFLLKEGTDQRYGARHLKRAIERHVVYPLANLLATEQIHLGDLLCIDWDRDRDNLIFVREGENLAMPARRLEPAQPARVAKAHSGKSVEAPASNAPPDPTPRVAR